MLTWDATAQAQIDSKVYGVCWLIEADFASGTQYLCTWGTELVTNGHTYQPVGGGVRVTRLAESEDSPGSKLRFTVSLYDTSMLAKSMGAATEYRSKAVRLYLQIVSQAGKPAGAPKRRWHGYIDAMSIEREQPDPKGKKSDQVGRIIIMASRAGVSRSRRNEGLVISDAQQQVEYAGDKGYEYLQSLIEKPVLWLSKVFQEVR